MLQIFTYVTDIHHVADILTEGAAAADQVPREVPDQEHERSDGGGREVGPVSTRGDGCYSFVRPCTNHPRISWPSKSTALTANLRMFNGLDLSVPVH